MASRLAHVGMRNLKDLLKGEHILGLINVSFEKDRVCSACIAGKQHQEKHTPKNVVSTSRPLELLHVDLFGPPSWDSLGGKKYGSVIVDDYSRYRCYSSSPRTRRRPPSLTSPSKPKGNITWLSWQ